MQVSHSNEVQVLNKIIQVIVIVQLCEMNKER